MIEVSRRTTVSLALCLPSQKAIREWAGRNAISCARSCESGAEKGKREIIMDQEAVDGLIRNCRVRLFGSGAQVQIGQRK